MAKKQDNDLFDALRASGLRKKVARGLTDSAARAKSGKHSSTVTRTVESLRDVASELESRVSHSSRSDAAKKAARTRKRNADKRSASARKAAKTRSRLS
jgi:hypothetical protein